MNESRPWEHLIDEDRLVELNRQLVSSKGGLLSTPNRACLDRALGGAWTAEGYARQSDDAEIQEGLVFAGHLLYYLARDSCFGDGNKRTALAGMQEVLGALGLTIGASTEVIAEWVDLVAKGEVKSAGQALAWIAERLVELE